MPRAGKLRHRVAIQSATESRDAHGGVTRSWATDDTVWGDVSPVSGDEFWRGQQVNSRITHRVKIRFYAGIKTGDRLTHDGRILHIDSITNPDERNITLELLCFEDVQEVDTT